MADLAGFGILDADASLRPCPDDLHDFGAILEYRALHSPEALAFAMLDDMLAVSGQLTYAGIYHAARQLAAGLHGAARSGERCLLLLPPGLDFNIAFFGCLMAGIVPVPAPPFPTRRYQERIVHVATNANALIGLTNDAFLDLVGQQSNLYRAIRWRTVGAMCAAGQDNAWQPTAADPDALALLQYTSGSTGRPRGVRVLHRNLVANAQALRAAMAIGPDTIGLSWLPVHHDMGLIGCVLQPVFTGRPLYQMSPQHFARRPLDWLRAIDRYRATVSGGSDFAYRLCNDAADSDPVEGIDLGCWAVAFSGAEAVRAGTMQRFCSTFAGHGFDPAAVMPAYGMAEATLWIAGRSAGSGFAAHRLDRESLAQGHAAPGNGAESAALVGCGGPAPGGEIRIVDPDSGSACADRALGEIWFRGPGVADGYWNDPAATAERFDARLAPDDGGYLRTGDLGFLLDGEVIVAARCKDLIIVNGRNHYPDDIESVVRTADAALATAFCAAFSIEREDAETLVIVVEAGTRHLPAADELRLHRAIRSALSRELGLAGEIRFVAHGQIPRTSSGKVQRSACRRRFQAGELRAAGGDARPIAETVTPQLSGLWEARLRPLLAEALRCGAAQIDAAAPLSAQGLDSLAAMRIAGALRQQAGIHVSLDSLFEGASLDSLAAMAAAHAQMTVSASIMVGGDVHAPFPLRPIQQAYLVGRDPAIAFGGIATAVYAEFDGAHDASAIEAAWNAMIAHHPMLRAVITADGAQCIAESVPHYAIVQHDLAATGDDALAWLATCRDAMTRRMPPPGSWPLFELRLTCLADGTRRLHVAIDMMIADLASIMTLLDELGSRLAGIVPPPLGITFRDYVLAERALVESAANETARAYWTDRIASLPGLPQLPVAAFAEAPPFARRRLRLDRDCWGSFCEHARRRSLTPAAALCAAFAEVVTRWSASAHVLLALTLNDRLPLHPDVDFLVGDFTRVSLLEIDNRIAAPFGDRARAQQDQLRRDLDHRLHDGVEVLRQLAQHDPDAPPQGLVVFTSGLGLLPGPVRSRAAMSDRRLGTMGEGLSQTSRVALDHQVIEIDGGVDIHWDAPAAIFCPGVLDAMFEAYRDLLERLATDDAAWDDPSPVSIPATQLRDRHKANATTKPLPTGRLADGLRLQADRQGEALALAGPGIALSHAELSQRAGALAAALTAAGATGPVAVIAGYGVASIIGVIGVALAGLAYLPIDADMPRQRRDTLIARAGAHWLVAAADSDVDWPDGLGRIMLTPDGWPAGAIDPNTIAQPNDPMTTDAAYVIFTSGSTGTPKGVVMSDAAAVNTLADLIDRFGIGPADRVLGLSSLGFDLSVFDIFGMLAAGGAVIVPSAADRLEPRRWCEQMARHGVTIWNSVPALMELAVDHLERRGIGAEDIPLRLVLLSGDWIPVSLPGRIRALWPDCRIVSLGGATEAAIWSIAHEINGDTADWPSVPYGRPLANQRFHVLDAQQRPCPDWVEGELYIAGAGLARGYVGDPETTDARFVTGTDGERLYRTGDLGRYRPGGIIEFLGRADGQVKVNGHRIELGEIEAALAAQPGVRQAVALRLGDRHAGQLAAYVTLAHSATLSADMLIAGLRARLPDYMVPLRISILDSLPLGPNGKVDRKRLPGSGHASSPGIDSDTAAADRAFVDRIGAIVARAIGVDRVSPDANFFDLGATSFHLMLIRSAIEAEIGRPVALTELFRSTSAAALARTLQPPQVAPAHLPIAAITARSEAADDIAIIGLSGRFPGSPTLADFWRNLQSGDDGFTDLPGDGDRVRRAARLDDVDRFDAAFFGISPREAELMDPQHRLFLECAWDALEDAGYPPGRSGGRIGVYGGASLSTYLLLTAHDLSPDSPSRFLETLIANDKDYLASRVSYKLDLDGPSVVVQTACSTSLVAVATAAQALRSGDCDMALAGGVTIRLPQDDGYRWEKGGVLSASGHCRPFDAEADGTVFGSGVGVVVLKRLSDAVRDGDAIDAVIRGWAVNNDGARKLGFTAPAVSGQVAVLKAAYDHAGLTPAEIGYIEAHGTGTPLGDPVEIAALREVFGDPADGQPWCTLGSVKGHVGHLDAAAGVAGLIKTVLALRHRRIPPIAHLRRASPHLPLEGGPFRLAGRAADWTSRPGQPLRAGVSAFGVGGTNCHIVLESAPPPPKRDPVTASAADRLILLSASTPKALQQRAAQLARALADDPVILLCDLAATLALGRRHLAERAAFVAGDADTLRAMLDAFARTGTCSTLAEGPLGERARHWLAGEEIDYAALAAPGWRRVHLPGYPWQRETHWRRGDAPTRNLATADPPEGMAWRSLNVATLAAGQAVFEARLSIDRCPMLADHRIFGAIVVPGTLMIELAVRAASAFLETDAIELIDLQLRAPVLLDDGDTVVLQIVIEDHGGGRRFRLLGQAADARAGWTLHASGRILPWTDEYPDAEPPPIGDTATRDRLYAELAARGVDLGETFRSIKSLAQQPGGASGVIRGSAVSDFFFDPAVLDGCFQVVAGAADHIAAGTDAYLPVSVDRLRIRRLASTAPVRSRATLREGGTTSTVIADVAVTSADAQTVALAQGIRFARTSAQMLLGAKAPTEGAYRTVWMPCPPTGISSTARRWLFVDVDGAAAQGCGDAAHATGSSDAVAKLRSLAAAGEPFGIALCGWTNAEPYGFAACNLALDIIQALIELAPGTDPTIAAITRGAMQVASEDRVDPFQACIWGLIRSAANERPGWTFTAIDLDAEAAGSRNWQSILYEGQESEQAWRAGLRLVPRIDRFVPPAAMPATADDTHIVTGGSGALGIAVSKRLAARGARLIVWLHRSALNEGALAAKAEIEAGGTRVLALRYDVADTDDLAAALAIVRAQGTIRGVHHLAATLEDRLVTNLDAADLQKGLAAKAHGAWNLHRLVTEPLAEFVCFSSLAGTIGANGQAVYAAGNLFVEALVQMRRADGQSAQCVAWGPWAGCGMAARLPEPLRQRLERQGLRSLAPHHALGLLERLAAAGDPVAIVANIDWAAFARNSLTRLPARFDRVAPRRIALPPTSSAFVQRLRAMPIDPRSSALQAWLREQLARHLALAGPEAVTLRGRLFDLGLDSLLLVELTAQLERELGIELPASLLFDYPTVEALAGHLAMRLDDDGPAAEQDSAPESLPAVAVADLLKETSALSDSDLLHRLTSGSAGRSDEGRGQ